MLVGDEGAFNNKAVGRIFDGPSFRLLARASTLLEALPCLEPGVIGLVVLSNEYRDEEVALFTIEACRRGFAGLIFRPANTPKDTGSSGIESYQKTPAQVGDFFIDISSRRLWIRGVETQCTPLEFKLLTFLCGHPEELLSHKTLREALWRIPEVQQHSLRVLIRAVRLKIESTALPRYIVTQRSLGYRFIPSPEPLS
jgi:DNA-binding winged helix-turn-helix (wHTH) protein